MKMDDLPTIEEQLANIRQMRDDEIDLSDIPEITDWSNAMNKSEYETFRQARALGIDPDIILWFLKRSSKFQTEINSVLRNYMLSHV